MSKINRHWNGYVAGTNTGKMYLEFIQQENEKLNAVLRFNDDTYGLVVYELQGEMNDTTISLLGKVIHHEKEVIVGDLTITCNLTSEGNLEGTWRTSIESGGTFRSYPFNPSISQPSAAKTPEQIYTKRIELGFIQLYKDEVKSITDFIQKLVPSAKPVITYVASDDVEGINYYEDFFARTDISTLKYFKVFVSEPDSYNISRNITMELRAHGVNEIRTQGIMEAWVLGNAELVNNYMKRYKDIIRSFIHKFVLSLQIFCLISMTIWITEVPKFLDKVLIGIFTFALLRIIPPIFSRMFPNASIKLNDQKPSWFIRLLNKGGNWIIAVLISIFAIVITKYYNDIASNIIMWIDRIR